MTPGVISFCDTFQMDEAWQPDEFLAEFDSDTFDVETHATEILRTGNINEEVSDRLGLSLIAK